MAEANHAAGFSRPDQLVVVDEADTLEKELLGHVGVEIGPRRFRELGVGEPGDDYRAWATPAIERAKQLAAGYEHEADELRRTDANAAARAKRQATGWRNLAWRLKCMVNDLARDPNSWVYQRVDNGRYGATLTFTPVFVRRYAQDMLWRHGARFLLMSATLLAPDVYARELGIPDGQWEFLELDSTFPAERRPIHFWPSGSMAFKHREESLPGMVEALDRVLDRHHGRVLVHSQTFGLAKEVATRFAVRVRGLEGRRRGVLHFLAASIAAEPDPPDPPDPKRLSKSESEFGRDGVGPEGGSGPNLAVTPTGPTNRTQVANSEFESKTPGPVGPVGPVIRDKRGSTRNGSPGPSCPGCGGPVVCSQPDDGHCDRCKKYVRPVYAGTMA